jgi:hypothetical protein
MIDRRFVPVENVDPSSCDREPIHLSGAIQPHGMLLALKNADLRIVAVSANAAAFIGADARRLLHRPLAEVVPSTLFERLEEPLLAANPRAFNPIRLELGPRSAPFDAIVHRVGETYIIEFEPSEPGADAQSFRALHSLVERAQGASDLAELCANLVDDVRGLTGFDRVMVYRFDEDWHGQVVAESVARGMTPYLNLHFPASDIPRQARELYTRNFIRLIPDARYEPVPLVPERDVSPGAPLDLSGAAGRRGAPRSRRAPPAWHDSDTGRRAGNHRLAAAAWYRRRVLDRVAGNGTRAVCAIRRRRERSACATCLAPCRLVPLVVSSRGGSDDAWGGDPAKATETDAKGARARRRRRGAPSGNLRQPAFECGEVQRQARPLDLGFDGKRRGCRIRRRRHRDTR